MHAAKEIVLSKVFWEYVIVFEDLKMETARTILRFHAQENMYYGMHAYSVYYIHCQLKKWAVQIIILWLTQMEMENQTSVD